MPPTHFPHKPIRIISPFSAGSPPDAFGRLVAQQLSASLGQSVVVENRPGAGTTLGTKAGAMADPDGYTLVQVNAALSYAPVLYPNAGYDPVKSFVPIALLASWTHVLVAHPSVPANTLQELIAYAKANPGKLNIGSPLGSPPHVLAAHASDRDRCRLQRRSLSPGAAARVGFRGRPRATLFQRRRTDRLDDPRGQDQGVSPHRAQRAIRCCRMFRPWPRPGLPTMTVDPSDWTGLLAPAGTPPEVVAKLNAAINEVLKSPEVRASWPSSAGDRSPPHRRSSRRSCRPMRGKWPHVVKAAGLKAD